MSDKWNIWNSAFIVGSEESLKVLIVTQISKEIILV